MDHYQNGPDRLDSPMRRRPTALTSQSTGTPRHPRGGRARRGRRARPARRRGHPALRRRQQGNHLGATYADSTIKALGIRYRSNALAQEKTGEGWVQGKMIGSGAHCDFEHAEVAVFLGKNPWHSHGFARARLILKEIQKDPTRTLIVIDPRRTETAEMADHHLAVKPGTDAWCLAAIAAVVVQEGLAPMDWHAAHTGGFDEVAAALRDVPVAQYAQRCGVDEALIRTVARRIAGAKSVSMLEDLGVQMNLHSTLNSYLNRLVWLLTGHYGRQGTNNAFVPLLSLSQSSRDRGQRAPGANQPRPWAASPVHGHKVIMGLIPCNAIPEEILTDHPKRFRAMVIESANPVHSLADSQRMRQALRALDFSVVIDVAMTETARQADYVLPASSQFEKAEATFFNMEVPHNAFHLRAPLFPPRPGTLTEAEIHSRLVEALGAVGEPQYRWLRRAARWGLGAFTAAFAWRSARDPAVARHASVVLHRTLGPTLPTGFAAAASLWGVCQMYLRRQPRAAAAAGFGGWAPAAANRLFRAILTSPSGLVFARTRYEDSWQAVRRPGHRIQLALPEMLAALRGLAQDAPPQDADYPFVLCAGERRSETSNTSIRDNSWHHKGDFGALRVCPQDAQQIGCADGDWVRITTRRASATAPVELTDTLQPGLVTLPNGLGLDTTCPGGRTVRRGVSLNELTGSFDRDPFAGTPWHKHVPARLERIVMP
ncbi:MAG: molybdopterin-dependent oxidoreductase [Burkholderiaceae bacterium]